MIQASSKPAPRHDLEVEFATNSQLRSAYPDGRARSRSPRPVDRYAAWTGERAEMIRDNSWREVPGISSDLIRRSSDTEGSPASILAMRD